MKQIRFYLVYAVLILTTLFIVLHEDVYEPVARPLSQIPLRVAGWEKIGETYFSEAVLKGLKPTEYLYRVYTNAQRRTVSIYLGYHGGGPDSGSIHSPKHCLPGSGWHNISEQVKTLIIHGEPVKIVESVYENDGQRELFLYWFQVKGENLTNEYALKFAEIKNSILYNRRDSAFIRISLPYPAGDDGAFVIGEQFVSDFYPHIKAVLPR